MMFSYKKSHYAVFYDKVILEVDGDVTALLSQSGNVAVEYYYDAFGTITEETASVNNPFR